MTFVVDAVFQAALELVPIVKGRNLCEILCEGLFVFPSIIKELRHVETASARVHAD